MGWTEYGQGFLRGSGDLQETSSRLPDYTSNLQLLPDLWKYAADRDVEFSFYMMLYNKTPVYQAAFIQGRQQFTSKDADPVLSIARAFIQVFGHANN